ncbi:unnamed protein product, partial [Amoebophrya sp. A25]
RSSVATCLRLLLSHTSTTNTFDFASALRKDLMDLDYFRVASALTRTSEGLGGAKDLTDLLRIA